MSSTLKPETTADLLGMSQVMMNAIVANVCLTAMKGTMSHEEEYKFTLARPENPLGAGVEAGVSGVWQVVDGNKFVQASTLKNRV